MSDDPTKLGPGEEWDATKGALAEAEATGTDIGPIEGTGPGGTVTKADVTKAAAPAKAKKAAKASNWYFDLSAKPYPDLLDENRFFQFDTPDDNPNACPERDGVQVNAVPVPDKGSYPKEILEVAARIAQK